MALGCIVSVRVSFRFSLFAMLIIQRLNRKSERIPRCLRRGKRADQNQEEFLTVENSLPLAAGNLQLCRGIDGKNFCSNQANKSV
jgi:hypothetical protein